MRHAAGLVVLAALVLPGSAAASSITFVCGKDLCRVAGDARYLDVVPLPDGSHELRTEAVPASGQARSR